MELPQRVLSVRQPWAWAIISAGKDIENRDWKPWNPGRKYRGDVLLHASKGMTRAEYEEFINTARAIGQVRPFPRRLMLPAFDDLRRGGIVGVVEVVDCVSHHESPWFFGPCGLLLRNPRSLPFTPLTGALGFFPVAPDVVARIGASA